VDPEFVRLLFRVTLLGGSIGVIGTVILYFAFRAYAPEAAGGKEFKAVILVISLLAFVLLCCALLLRLGSDL